MRPAATLCLFFLFAPSAQATEIIWAGLDYSMAKMASPSDFKDADKIFPGYLHKWNDLVVKEKLGEIESALGRRVVVDTSAVEGPNARAQPDQIVRSIPERDQISKKMVARAVRGYQMTEKKGLGLVFIIERLEKRRPTGCMHVVFFDVATRRVLVDQTECGEPRGWGFRNYWFGAVKAVIKDLGKLRGKIN